MGVGPHRSGENEAAVSPQLTLSGVCGGKVVSAVSHAKRRQETLRNLGFARTGAERPAGRSRHSLFF